MSTTLDNPGAFRSVPPRSLRGAAAASLRLLRRGEVRGAVLSALVDASNLLEARAGRALRPRFQCSCCGHEAHAFRHTFSGGHAVWNSACPACDSRSRHRGLALLLPRLIEKYEPRRVLHFAPEAVLRRCFAAPTITYETADLYLEDATHRGVDLEHLPFADGSYDMVVCNHVLEHIAHDETALAQIRRVLSPRGVAVITVPGDFTRAETVMFTGELPNGHYRDYGTEFLDVLRRIFSHVDAVDLHELDRGERVTHAIKPRDLAFVCAR